MPRNVRNFWVTMDVDGRKEAVATGPRRADGGIDITIKMRDGGGVVDVCEIVGRVDDKGALTLTIFPNHDHTIVGGDDICIRTER
jgi:hypothetical protein